MYIFQMHKSLESLHGVKKSSLIAARLGCHYKIPTNDRLENITCFPSLLYFLYEDKCFEEFYQLTIISF